MGSRRDAFFAGSMHVVDVRGWPAELVHPARALEDRVTAPDGARLVVRSVHPHDDRPLPAAGDDAPLLDTGTFALGHSGNRTLQAPKRSWTVELPDGAELAGMGRLDLKAMYNDPSQMREALAWRLFGQAGVTAPRHTYARLGVNGTYLGLFSVIEHVDRSFLRSRLPGRDRGNLYKVSCGDLGCGTLERRHGPHGEDGGEQYRSHDPQDPTYRLRSYVDGPDDDSHDDLATLVRVLDGDGLPGGGGRFGTDAYAGRMREVLDVEEFLRWAGANVLLGSWDNYFATPANYYLYNGGHPGADGAAATDVRDRPYFTFVPWDYDNCLGIDYFGTSWQYTDLLDWPATTQAYRRFNGGGGRSHVPLVTNLLANAAFRRYYLDHLEHLLDTVFTPAAFDAAIGIGPDGEPTGDGLWDRVATSAYLEAATPTGRPSTGRQFVNDEVYRAGCRQQELRRRDAFVLGVHHYVRMRYDSAREQLRDLRRADPAGSSGARFTDRTAGPVPVAVG